MAVIRRWSIRPGTPYEAPVLQRMIYEALYWQPDAEREPFEFVIVHDEIVRYVEGWGRPGDGAVIADCVDIREPIGAAWYRRFTKDAPGYGFVSEDIPEVSIAVDREYRGLGIGRALMVTLIDMARESDIPMLSLSVDSANVRALGLYERLGFRIVGGDEQNPTMLLELSKAT
jgi:ribosomal protein S18 acetylase RimI-like enzyme